MNTAKNPGSNPMFNFEGKDVRVILFDGKPWFVVVDASLALGKTRDSFNTVGILDQDEWMVLHKNKAEVSSLVLFNKNAGRLVLVSESGLYKLIMRANPRTNPVAKRFQNWVTRDVLPALRQDGMYAMGEEKVKTGEMTPDELILLGYEALLVKAKRLDEECAKQKAIIRDNLILLTLDAWCALNSHYLTPSERGSMAWKLRKLREAEGMTCAKEVRTLTLPGGKVKQVALNIYPKDMIDTAAGQLGITVNMKFALVAKVA